MAQAILRPSVSELVEGMSEKGDPDLRLEEQLVDPGSALDGRTVGKSGLRQHGGGLILVAIKHQDGRLDFDPTDEDPVVAGDIVITLQCHVQRRGSDATAFSR